MRLTPLQYLFADRILLYTVDLYPVSPGAAAVLHVAPREPPADPNHACPLAFVGDCPGPIRACVDGGTLLVNSDTPCSVAIAPATWTAVRRLFQ
jgi:hypothetical protein